MIFFVATGQVLYALAIPMAVCNVAGSMLGSQLAILKGSRFVRIFFLVIVAALIAKLGRDMLWSQPPLRTSPVPSANPVTVEG